MRFKHRGKLGDIVYSLAAVRAFHGSSYFIDANGIEMPPTATAAILPLLNAQPYIEEADAWRGQPIDHDLDGFRAWDPTVHNLADCHLRSMNLPLSLRDVPWIEVACARKLGSVEIIFSRSERYHGSPGIMEELYRQFAGRGAFVGSGAEYKNFCDEFGPLHYVATDNLLVLAEVIAGCRLFIGNQSCPLAIAEALKVRLIQEVCHKDPNCVFYRENAYPVWQPAQLPSILHELSCRMHQF